MRFAERRQRLWHFATLAAVGLAACGGGNSTTTTTICTDTTVCTVQLAAQGTPTGPNTTEIVVDGGPTGAFALGVTNVPYVSVTVCDPGSTATASNCTTIDHVLLDTGSYGLRLLKSKVTGLHLPSVAVAADVGNGTPAGIAAECYAFVLGAVWGPLAKADIRLGGELAPNLTLQLIDDGTAPALSAPANCLASAQSGLLNSVTQLQANGILGIGAVSVDCGASCLDNTYPGGYVVYYSCPPQGAACMPAAMPAVAQVQNPVSAFVANSDGTIDNNGTMIAMPALPKLGATVAKGRLVFGIGTQRNNQLPPAARIYKLNADPASADYLYVSVQVGARRYAQSFIDTGSNAMFFDDAALPLTCSASTGAKGRWYCPATSWRQTAGLTDATGVQGSFDIAVESADTLFNTGAVAFANLAGSAGQAQQTFVVGLPFFYGRQVFQSIWGQALATNGPWYAF